MGLSISSLLLSWMKILKKLVGCPGNVEKVIARAMSCDGKEREMNLRMVSFKIKDYEVISKSNEADKMGIEESVSSNNQEPGKLKLHTAVVNLVLGGEKFGSTTLKKDDESTQMLKPTESFPEPAIMFSPRPISELDAAAVKLQKVYKSYRTRRNLADCAVVVEELWWKALDYASLKRSSVSFFSIEKHETAVSRWSRARTRAAKVGKGLSKDEKAQKLALQHWLEAIDPRHRYGHNLHLYYDVWFYGESTQPFFYWLDVGNGKELNLESCSRSELQRQCIKYLGPKEREIFEVVVESGKLVYRQSGIPVETNEDSKWIFVLSTSRALYVGQKKKGLFQHSSFLAGGATTAAGRMVAHNGVLEAIWPYSGHYHPTEENFQEFISFLEEHHVDLTNVKRCAIDDDSPSFNVKEESRPELVENSKFAPSADINAADVDGITKETTITTTTTTTTTTTAAITDTTNDNQEDYRDTNMEAPLFDLSKRLSCKWSTGAGPRIGCVRDYPQELQYQALEQVNLSPRVAPFGNSRPIPSPRPSPKIRVSPRLAYMGLPSPRVVVSTAN